MNYRSSPVGPYLEHAVARLEASGPSVIAMTVTSPESLQAGRELWGFPKELADLGWSEGARHIDFRDGDRHWRFRPWGPSWPFHMAGWTKQRRAGQTVFVPLQARGRVRLAFNGRRWALLCDPLRLCVHPARSSPHPVRSSP